MPKMTKMGMSRIAARIVKAIIVAPLVYYLNCLARSKIIKRGAKTIAAKMVRVNIIFNLSA